MKKLINTALVYLIAGAAAGVFFREFTNFAQFTGRPRWDLCARTCWCSGSRYS